MNWKFDPALSSADYLALARSFPLPTKFPIEFRWILDSEVVDFGVHRGHVDQLLDRRNWSATVVRDGRKPRVFIDAYVNRSNNLEIRSVGGCQKIYFEDDFTRPFLREATSGHYGVHRSVGEIMWIKDFGGLQWIAIHRNSPVAKALLFGFKARLDEVIAEISAEMDVVGAMPMQFRYEGENLVDVEFEPTVSKERIRALQEEMFPDDS